MKNVWRHMQRPAVLSMCVVAGMYCWLAFVYLPANFYWAPEDGLQRIQSENMRFTPLPDLSITYPGRHIDADFQFVPFQNIFYYVHHEHLYFVHSAIIAGLSRPFLLLLGDRGRFVMPILFGLISVYLVGLLAQRLDLGAAWLAMPVVGLATPMVIYSLFFREQTLSVALCLGGIYLVSGRPKHLPGRTAIASGALIAAAMIIRKELALVVPFLGLQLGRRVLQHEPWRHLPAWRSLVAWGSALLLLITVYIIFTYATTGSWVPPELRFNTVPTYSERSYLLKHSLNAAVDFIFDRRYGTGLGSVLVIAVVLYWLADWRCDAHRRDVLQTIALSTLGVGVGSFTWNYVTQPTPDTYNLFGVLSVSPFLVLDIARRFSSHEPETMQNASDLRLVAVGFLCVAVLGLGLCTRQGPTSDPAWGARYFLIAFALGTPLALYLLRQLWQQRRQSLAARLHWTMGAVLVCLSVVVNLLGVRQFRSLAPPTFAWTAALAAVDEKQLVTDWPLMSALAPQLFMTREIYFTSTLDELRDWVRQASAHGVHSFAYVARRDQQAFVPFNSNILEHISPPEVRVVLIEDRVLEPGLHILWLRIMPVPPAAG